MKKEDIVYHKLTGEKVMIIDELESQYLVRLDNYAEILVKKFEVQFVSPKVTDES